MLFFGHVRLIGRIRYCILGDSGRMMYVCPDPEQMAIIPPVRIPRSPCQRLPITNFITRKNTPGHGLSQQGVWVPFWTPKPLKRTPQDTQILLCGISKNPNLKLIIELFHLLIIPMTLFNDILPYFDEFLHVYG